MESSNFAPQHYRAAEVLEFASLLSVLSINVSECRAVLFIFLAGSEPDNASFPSVADVADALSMSHSGASRLLLGLTSRQNPLIFADKKRSKGRKEAFCCTEYGQSMVTRFLSIIFTRQIEVDLAELESFPQYTPNNFCEEVEPKCILNITFIGWDNASFSFSLDQGGSELRNEISGWCFNNAIYSEIGKNLPNEIVVRLPNRSVALVFIGRWGLPIKIIKTFESGAYFTFPL